MAGSFVIESLLAALGIAINPPAVIASILLASISRRKALAFAAGWVTGLFLVGLVVVLVGEAIELAGVTSVWVLVAKVAIGVTLLWLGTAKWRSYRTVSGDKGSPVWMRRLHGISAARAFLLAVAYASLNPKTVAFGAAGVVAILGASLGATTTGILLGMFIVLSSLTVTAPVAFAVLAPQRSTQALASGERWLGDHGRAVGAVVLLVLGVVVLYSGTEGLLHLR
ncbi:MAG: GAP family protein [Coriobacteriia bacterium]|nr:GAP family protein [Coriobacteriia bacterium]